MEARPYKKRKLRDYRPGSRQVWLRMWGAIGDYYWFLAYVTPLLRERKDDWKVLAADVYPRYRSDPVGDLCIANGFIDELWTHPRAHAGPNAAPVEYIRQATNPDPKVDMFTPAAWYDKVLSGPGVVPMPNDWLIEQHRLHPKHLVKPMSDSALEAKFGLPPRYITLQPITNWKKRNNVVPDEALRALKLINVPTVVMRFPGGFKLREYFRKNFEDRNHIRIVDCRGPVESLAVQARALCHLGVESSQTLGAAIQDVPTLYFPVGGLSQFRRDLSLDPVCHIVKWGETAANIALLMETVTDGDIQYG